MAKAPGKPASAATTDAAAERVRILALSNLDVDGVRIAEGEAAEIRAELAQPLLDLGRAALAPEEG